MDRPLHLITDAPWYYFATCLAAGALVSLFLYFRHRQNAEVPRYITIVLAITRFFSFSLCALLLLEIFLRTLTNKTEQPIVLLAIDNSSSMVAGKDSQLVRTKFTDDLVALRERLSEKYEVHTLTFGDKTGTAERPDYSEKTTDLDELFRDAENNFANQNTGAMIVVSDGIFNRGINPLNSASRLHYPVYTVAMGDTTEVKDIAIEKVTHNQVAYLGNDFPVEVSFRAKQFAGREAEISISENGVTKGVQKVRLTSSDHFSTATFTLNAAKPGLITFNVSVPVFEGDRHPQNNKQSFFVEVLDNREKVLLVASAPHPDIAAIKEALANGSFDLEFIYASAFPASPGKFALVILHGGGLGALTSQCEAAAVPYLVINPKSGDALPGLRVTGIQNRFNDAEPVPNSSFGLFNISDALKRFLSALPAVKVPFGNYSMANGVNVLLDQKIGSVETSTPLFLFSERNGLKSGVFAGDGLWRWKMRDYAEHGSTTLFNELISKSVQWMAVRNDKSFFRVSGPRLVDENTPVEFTAEVYNKSYEAITDPEVSVTIINARKEKFSYTFTRGLRQYFLNAGLFSPGEYTYEAQVKAGGELYVKRGTFVVREIIAEKVNAVADHGLLYRISRASNGKMFFPGDLDKLEAALISNEQIKPVVYSETSTSPLTDLKWLFFVLLVIFCVEWFIRKRFYVI